MIGERGEVSSPHAHNARQPETKTQTNALLETRPRVTVAIYAFVQAFLAIAKRSLKLKNDRGFPNL